MGLPRSSASRWAGIDKGRVSNSVFRLGWASSGKIEDDPEDLGTSWQSSAEERPGGWPGGEKVFDEVQLDMTPVEPAAPALNVFKRS